MSDEEFKTIHCACGNKIEFTDSYEPGFCYNDDTNFRCKKCNKVHTVNVKDMIFDLKGGSII